MQVIEEQQLEEMSGSELLDHLDLLHATQRRAEAEILSAAAQHAIIHNPETLDPMVSRLNGRERARRFGGHGTPQVWISPRRPRRPAGPVELLRA